MEKNNFIFVSITIIYLIVLGLLSFHSYELSEENKSLREMNENNVFVTMGAIEEYQQCSARLVETKNELKETKRLLDAVLKIGDSEDD